MSMATRTGTQPPALHLRQPRPDPRARRAREQPQGRQRRDPEAPADGVHRRLRLGQELAGVRHDRRGVAAADQRDLQRLRAGLHADAGAARGRRARRADDRDHRRPAADGRRRPLHGRHRHRRQRDAAHPLQPARAAAHRLAQRVLLQRRLGPGERCDHGRARRRQDRESRPSPAPAACARAARAGARSPTSTCPSSTTTPSRSPRARSPSPATPWTAWYGAALHRVGLPRPGQADPQVHQEGAARLPPPRADQDEGRRRQPHLRGADPARSRSRSCPRTAEALQPHIRAFVDRAVTFTACPECGGTRLSEAARSSQIKRDQHRRRVRDADQRPGRVGARPRRAVGGAAAGGAAADPRLVRGDRAGLPLARPAVGHAVGRRGAARQDDPPPRLLAHRRHLRLRRADDRACTPTTSSG